MNPINNDYWVAMGGVVSRLSKDLQVLERLGAEAVSTLHAAAQESHPESWSAHAEERNGVASAKRTSTVSMARAAQKMDRSSTDPSPRPGECGPRIASALAPVPEASSLPV